jgi:hypothetical protein
MSLVGNFVGRGCLRPGAMRRSDRTSGRRSVREGRRDRQPQPPLPEPGAIWQAGVTPDSNRFRVMFNGEPRPDAVAAGADWIIALPDMHVTRLRPCRSCPLGWAELADPFAPTRRLIGLVEILPDDSEQR